MAGETGDQLFAKNCMLWTVLWSGAWMSSDGFQFAVVTVYRMSWVCTIYLPTIVNYVYVIRCNQSRFNVYWGTNAYIHVFACHITKLVLVIWHGWANKKTASAGNAYSGFQISSHNLEIVHVFCVILRMCTHFQNSGLASCNFEIVHTCVYANMRAWSIHKQTAHFM